MITPVHAVGFIHFMMPAITIAVVAGIIAAGIALSVIIGQQISSFQNTEIVEQSSATIVLNRLIESNELPYFYDALETLDVIIKNIKDVLGSKFGKRFINVELIDFTSEPIVISKKTSNIPSKRQIPFNDHETKPPLINGNVNNNCSVLVRLKKCTADVTEEDCLNKVISIENCRNAKNDIVQCVNETIQVYNCLDQMNDIIDCDNAIITTQHNCSNKTNLSTVTPSTTVIRTTSNTTIPITSTRTTRTIITSNTTIPITTTTITTESSPLSTTTTTATVINNNNTNECKPSQNTTSKSSIVKSKMLLYFASKRSESISVDDIISALKTLKPTITLFTICGEASSQTSSFNSTLSIVEPLVQINKDVNLLANQPSISSALSDSVNASAFAALESVGLKNVSRTTTVTPTISTGVVTTLNTIVSSTIITTATTTTIASVTPQIG